MAEVKTPKKIVDFNLCFLCGKEVLSKKDRILVYGRSKLPVASLIRVAVGVDCEEYRESEGLFVCRSSCFKSLEKLERNTRTVEDLKLEFKTKFGEKQTRFQRLNTTEEDRPSRQLEPKALFTSTPVKIVSRIAFQPANVLQKSSTTQPQTNADCSKETKVSIKIEYPSKTMLKTLTGDSAKLAIALGRGTSALNVAKTILKSDEFRENIVSKVMNMVSSECDALCSRKNPSILRRSSKTDLENFSFKNVCDEWKEKAPIFYKFLMSCASKNKQDKWFPSVAVAGSVVLKQRNSHMSATASVLGVLMKSRAIEVFIYIFKQ